MKKILLLSVLIASSSIFTDIGHAKWIDPSEPCTTANATDVDATGLRSFPKGEGKKVLCLMQARQVSVYTTIQRNLIDDQANGYGYVQYITNGVAWDRTNSIPSYTWIDGYYYEDIRPNPNATYIVWDTYSREYWYDISNPLCGAVTIYTAPNVASQTLYVGGWTKNELYARIQCSDRYSGCPKEADGVINIYTDFLSLSHRAGTIDISFGDLVANQGTQTCNLNFGEYLYDPTPPKIVSLIDDVGNNLTTGTSQGYFAGNHKWTMTVSDPFDNNDQGVSGIKSVSMSIKRVKNTYGETTTPDTICTNTATYPALPNTNITTNNRTIELNCADTSGIQIAGTYELSIAFSDHAGNTITTNRDIFVAPNKTLVPKIVKETYEKGQTRVCLGTTNTTVCDRYTLDETPGYTNPGSCPGTAGTTPQYTKPTLIFGTEYTGASRDIWENQNVCRTDIVNTSTTTLTTTCDLMGGTGNCYNACYNFWGSFCMNLCDYGLCTVTPVVTVTPTYIQRLAYPRTTFYGTRTCVESRVVTTCTGGYDDSWGDTPSTTLFANTADYYKYTMSLTDNYGNPIHSKAVSNFIHTGTGIYLDSINNAGASALIFDHTNRLTTIGRGGAMGYFTMQSYAGGQFGEEFSVDIPDWNTSYQNVGTKTVTFGNGTIYDFHKLFTASMKLGNNETDIVFGQKQSLDFEIQRHDKAGTLVTNGGVNFRDFISSTPSTGWTLSNKTYSGASNTETAGYIKTFDTGNMAATGSIEFIPEILTKFTGTAGIEARPVVQYTINGKLVSYPLSETVDGIAPLTLAGGEINSIYIGGYEQSQGKGGIVSSSTKIGENSWTAVRNTIAKKVALLTRNRTPNDGLLPNGVKYVSGDQELSGEVTWKTLIVTDGNVTFADSFNTLKRNVGIIIMQGKTPGKGNIYIKPNVAFIGAMLFAEGSIESVNAAGNSFLVSDRSRTTTLANQIVFYGGLYTRNTVGGAVLGKIGDSYMLPGGVPTSNIQEAIRYDLSFLRMRSGGKDDTAWTKNYNEGHPDSVVVLRDTSSEKNPAPGFEQ